MDKGAAKEMILIYGVQPGSKRESQLKTALGFLGIPGTFLGKASLCQKVGYLAGLKGYERSEDQQMEAVERELMILSGMSPENLRARAQAMLEGDEAPDLKEIQALMDVIEAQEKG